MEWLYENFEFEFHKAEELLDPSLKSFPSDIAAQVVRDVCGVKTRTELNTSHAASLLFDSRIRGPYMAYQQECKEVV
jgi:hypothetical protein